MKKNPPFFLVGAGPMAVDHAAVLAALGVEFLTVGRGGGSADQFESKTGLSVFRGGVGLALKEVGVPESAVVSVGVESLAQVAQTLAQAGVKKILLEKPAGVTAQEIIDLNLCAEKCQTKVWIGYNRRFYSSVRMAKALIREDGGPLSFSFDFTEIPALLERFKGTEGRRKLFYANSTHVVDLAFYLGGEPTLINSVCDGFEAEGAPMRFAGSGVSASGATFHFGANWAGPGRWGVECVTARRRFILRPLEKLQVQEKGSFAISDVVIDDEIDRKYKPGLFEQAKAFFDNKPNENLMSLSAQARRVSVYENLLTPTKA